MSTATLIKINAGVESALERCRCSRGVSEPSSAKAATTQPAADPAACDKSSYGQILKSSALVGGSQVANIAISIVRTKAIAILLGPAGFGLFGLYGSIQNLTQNIAGMGINSSGVRQIAEAVGTGDKERIANTAAVLRRTAILLGVLGAIFLALFSRQISRLTFGSAERAGAVSLLSLAVLFALMSGGQSALIQGMRRVGDLARMNVLSALFGLCAGIPLVYFFRQNGVVPSLIVVAAASILTSWWYSHQIPIARCSVTLAAIRQETSELLRLGFVFMSSSLMTTGAAYAVRIIILRKLGFEATGLYQSAWTLGGLYVAFILQAMGADFYPRLTASARDDATCNRLVNEQTLIGMLLAGPGVIATLTFAPVVIWLFYSAKFAASVPVLRWICLGVALQVISWPMGYIIVAKAKKGLFFLAEFAWTLVAISLAWVCIGRFGLNGAGIAFFLSYVFHAVLIYVIVRRLSGFRWSRESFISVLFVAGLLTGQLVALHLMSFAFAVAAGAITTLLAAAVSVFILVRLSSSEILQSGSWAVPYIRRALARVPARARTTLLKARVLSDL